MARTKSTAGKSRSGTSSTPSKSASQPPAKKVRIAEPEASEEPSIQKSSAGQPRSILKGKGLLITSSQSAPTQAATENSETESEGVSPENETETVATSSQAKPKGKPKGRGKKKGTELPKAPSGFNTSSVIISNSSKYEEKLKNRPLCPAVYVDLKEIDGLGIKVSEFLEHYRPLIQIQEKFCPEIVRIFYNNMSSNSVLDEQGEIVSYSMITKMRNQEILITAEILNGFLGTKDYVKELSTLSNEEIFELLRPGETFPGILSFEPSSMPSEQRIIHYIYSRCIVNKSGNYTHFASGDYGNMARIMKKEKRNIGELVFDEMWRFVHSGSKRMIVPYPCLVSFILKSLKIWYILDKVVEPIQFGEAHLNRMNINVSNPQPRPKKAKRKATASASQGPDEAQSSAPQETSSAPSFTQAAIQHYVGAELQKWGASFTAAFHADITAYVQGLIKSSADYFSGAALDKTMASLISSVDSLKESVTTRLDSLETTMGQLKKKVETLEENFRGSQSQPQPSPSAPPSPSPEPPAQSPEVPSSEAILDMIDFSIPILNPEPQPIPAPPISSIAPSDSQPLSDTPSSPPK